MRRQNTILKVEAASQRGAATVERCAVLKIDVYTSQPTVVEPRLRLRLLHADMSKLTLVTAKEQNTGITPLPMSV